MSATVSDTARASRQGEIALPRPRTTWTGTPRRAAASVRLPSSPTPRANSKRSANPPIRSRTCDCAPPCTARVIRTRSRGRPGARLDAGSRAGASLAPTWLGTVLSSVGAALAAARDSCHARRRRRAGGAPAPRECRYGAHRRGAAVPLSVARPPSAARESRHARRRSGGGRPSPRCGARWRGAQDPLRGAAGPRPRATERITRDAERRAGAARPTGCLRKIPSSWGAVLRPRSTGGRTRRAGRPPHETVFGRGNRPGLKDTPCGRGVE